MASIMETMFDVSQPLSNDSHLRRNISIFSRRGNDSPPPLDETIMSSNMSFALGSSMPSFPAEPSQRTRRWRLSRQKSVVRPVRGTILRAVPKESPLRRQPTMTALEMEMATSPNEEILRKISMTPIVEANETILTLPSPALATPTIAELPLQTTPPPMSTRKRSRKERRTSPESAIIGVWQNGTTQWGIENVRAHPTDISALKKDAKSCDLQRSDTKMSTVVRRKEVRPSISVTIPDLSLPARSYSFERFDIDTTCESTLTRSKTASHAAIKRKNVPTHRPSPSDGDIKPLRTDSMQFTPSADKFPFIITKPSPEPSQQQTEAMSDCNLLRAQPGLPSTLCSSSSSVTSGNSDDEGCRSVRSSRTSMTSVGSYDEKEVVEPAMLQRKPTQKLKSRSSRSVRFSSTTDLIDPARAPEISGMGTRSRPAELEGSPITQNPPRLQSLVYQLRETSPERPVKRLSSRRGNLLLRRMNSNGSSRSRSSIQSTTTIEKSSNDALQEAQNDLERHLRHISTSSTGSENPLRVPDSTAFDDQMPPMIPKRSPKRAEFAVVRRRSSRLARIPSIGKKSSLRKRKATVSIEPSNTKEDISEETRVSAQQGMVIIRMIMERLDNLDDLFNTALLNKGFYRVYRRNELALIKTVLHKQCPPAWEWCQTNPPRSNGSESAVDKPSVKVAPATFLYEYTAGTYIIGALKDIIAQQCGSVLRKETLSALQNRDGTCSSPVDNALWRIWTFCKIFGSNRGRETDIVGQMDWLRGGVIAHQDQCTSSIAASDSFYISSVLLSASQHFARGNGADGLSAEELYDMLEMWRCLGSITKGILSKTEQARDYGIFEGIPVVAGNIQGESVILEEFQHYILSLGLSPILDIANHATSPSPSAFQLAQSHGWTKWSPPTDGYTLSRKDFLREAVTRLYEERVVEAFDVPEARLSHMRSLRRQRGTSLTEELRQAALSGVSVSGKPTISITERPVLRIDTTNAPRSRSLKPSVIVETTAARPASRNTGLLRAVSPTKTLRPTSFSTSSSAELRPQQAAGNTPPARLPRPVSLDASPIPAVAPLAIRHQRAVTWSSAPGQLTNVCSHSCPCHPPAAAAPAQPPNYRSAANNEAPKIRSELTDLLPADTVEHAVARLVEMGFTVTQAKGALKITDMGDGLRLDRAVEYLLRLGEGEY